MAAKASITVAVLMLFFLLHGEADATMCYVGGEFGWTNDVSMAVGLKAKRSMPGDILEFHYDRYSCDVAIVNKTRHDSCTVKEGAKVFRTGNDAIPLVFGANYFICSNALDCS